MATIVIEPKMDIDLPRPENEEDCYCQERKEVARVRVMESARGSGEMIGWLEYQTDEEGQNLPGRYRLPDGGEEYCPDLGDWLVERSGVDRMDWGDMVVQEEVWKAVIARFL